MSTQIQDYTYDDYLAEWGLRYGEAEEVEITDSYRNRESGYTSTWPVTLCKLSPEQFAAKYAEFKRMFDQIEELSKLGTPEAINERDTLFWTVRPLEMELLS